MDGSTELTTRDLDYLQRTDSEPIAVIRTDRGRLRRPGCGACCG